MSTQPKMSFEQGSKVWVWDSMWLPAVVVHRAQMGCLLVRLGHGVTFSVTVADLVPRDPACRGSDVPSSVGRRRSNSTGHQQELAKGAEPRWPQRNPIDGTF
jgi:hypothetical protein